MSNRVIIDQTTNIVNTDQCPEIHNTVVVNNEVPSNIDVIENVTNIVTVSVPGPQGPQGPQGPIGLGGDITGSQYYVAIYKSDTGLFTGSLYQSGSFTSIRNATAPEDVNNPDILYVNGDGVDTYNLISAHGNLNDFIQVNVQNYNIGGNASSDIVATKDDGTFDYGYVNMGINGSQYSNGSLVGGASDAYVYSLTNGNLYIGNAEIDKEVIIFNGGLDAAANSKIWIHNQGTVGINTSYYNPINPPALQISPPNLTTYNLIQAKGEVDSYLQTAVTNASIGTNASADIVAYNNIDPVTQSMGYIDMGINSTNYALNATYPGDAGHSYIFTDSDTFIIGTVSGSLDQVNIFVGSTNADTGSKLKLRANDIHSMTGSLNISGSLVVNDGITGSLYGTSSWALNALTASYLSGYVSPFPYTGSAIITGSLGITGSFSVTGSQITLGGLTSIIFDNNNYEGLNIRNTNIGAAALSGITIQSSSGDPVAQINYVSPVYGNPTLRNTFLFNTVGSQKLAFGTNTTGQPTRADIYFSVNPAYFLSATNPNQIQIVGSSRNVIINYSGTDTGENFQVNGTTRISGSSVITGSLNVTQGITASLFGTSSWAQNAVTSSYGGNFTASALLVNGTITAQTLVVQTITSSVEYSSGSNIFGSLLTNTQQFTGSVTVTGSLTVNGSPVILTNQTASMTVLSASYALTASYVSGASSTSVTASYAQTASYATNFYVSGTLNVNSSSLFYQQNLSVPTGSYQVVVSSPTASYRAAFFDYVMFSGSVGRAGTVYSVWSGSYAEYYENYTGDVGGSTSGVTLQAAISGSNIQLQATASNNFWTIRSLVRML